MDTSITREKKSHKAVGHWLIQRITAVLLIPLTLWAVSAFIKYLTAPFKDAQAWLASPLTKSALAGVTLLIFYHGYLGIQVILEDYVPHKTTRSYLIYFTGLFSFFMTVLAIISIIQIS